MEFGIDQAVFSSALALAQTVANRRASHAALANVLMTADEGGRLHFASTDTMISLNESVEAEIRKPGSLSASVRHLHTVVRTLGEGPVQVEGLDNNWVRIVSGRSEFKLVGASEQDFPALPDPDALSFRTIPGHRLTDLIQKTLFSVSADEARVNLNGALMESDGTTALMVSTDGHRLTKFSTPFEGPAFERPIVIPRKGMMELRKVLDRIKGDCELAVNDQHLFLRSDALRLSIKLNAVAFPPYAQVIPSRHERSVRCERSTLIAALRQAEVIAPEKTATVRVELKDNTLALSADNPDLGVSNQELEVEYDGDPLVAGFNAHYLLEALDAMDGEYVVLELQGELDPCVLRPDDEEIDFQAVVMPMRI